MPIKTYDPHNPIAMFDDFVPSDFCRRSVLFLYQCYSAAHHYCDTRFPRTEARDLYPHFRRAMFESGWRSVADLFKRAKAKPTPNCAQNCSHTLIGFGRVDLTASAVESPSTLVRPAVFRKTYAQSAQRQLFEPAPTSRPSASLYAILIHGPSSDPSRPAFAHVVFPTPECEAYIDRIDLLLRFPEIANRELERSPEETVQDAVEPRLRSGARKRKSEEA